MSAFAVNNPPMPPPTIAIEKPLRGTIALLSIFASAPQIFRKAGPDIRNKKLFDIHPAARQPLLVEMGNKRFQSRAAAFDRIIPDLRPENLPRFFHFVNHPRQT